MVNPISNLVTVAGQSVERSTLTGLQNASEKSGVSFQYLLAKAAQESSLQTDAKASTSSATGLFQFTRSTWLDMMKKYGALYGYADLADKIVIGENGKASVTEPAAEKRLLALRGNAEASGLMAAEYARDNATSLQGALGREVDAPDLYLAHFLGASGARDLLAAAESKPSSSAAALLPAAAKANTSIFYGPEGRARSAGEVVELIRGRFTDKMDRYAEVAASLAGDEMEQAAVAVTRPAPPAPMMPAKAGNGNADITKKMVSNFILEEMAKLIAAKPMVMSDGIDDENQPDDTTLGSNAFQGNEWSAVMTRALTRNETATPAPPQVRAADAMRTYDMLNAVPLVPAVAPRREPR
jgi:hypothetical protein